MKVDPAASQKTKAQPPGVERPPETTAPRKRSARLSLTGDQERAREAIFAWRRQHPKQVLTLGGYAGTGKTTVIAETIKSLAERPHIAFCCYTGKASDVLREKLLQAGALNAGDYCGTIHGLIYEKVGEDANASGRAEILWRKKETIKTDFLVVDEASMVSRDIWDDLCSYGVPILAVGDHGQLPPVGDKYNLMERPDVRLETIHRQAQASPIVKLSLLARQEGRIPPGEYGPSAVKTNDRQAPWRIKSLGKAMFLCGRNKTRVDLNAQIRERLKIQSSEPIARDRVICLRNARRFKVFNGMLGALKSVQVLGERHYRAQIEMDSDILFKGRICRAQFGEERTLEYEEGQGCLFDWGYALTVHKAQGSEARQVVLFEERFFQMSDDDWRRWLYTGVTRASEDLIIIGD
ncbi:MAG: AAA family ATPase [Elusimicrobia bacterium]|nr:AAA family ATPase [Elusimicrobiota bacterium]